MDLIPIFESTECKEFIRVAKDVREFVKHDILESPKLARQYKEALNKYRDYLDKLNLKMPDRKYPYSPTDERTWKFLDVRINQRRYLGAITNTKWIGNK